VNSWVLDLVCGDVLYLDLLGVESRREEELSLCIRARQVGGRYGIPGCERPCAGGCLQGTVMCLECHGVVSGMVQASQSVETAMDLDRHVGTLSRNSASRAADPVIDRDFHGAVSRMN
jgi:hypothetical protein